MFFKLFIIIILLIIFSLLGFSIFKAVGYYISYRRIKKREKKKIEVAKKIKELEVKDDF